MKDPELELPWDIPDDEKDVIRPPKDEVVGVHVLSLLLLDKKDDVHDKFFIGWCDYIG